MAKVNMEDIVDYLDREFRKALEESVKKEIPEANFNSYRLLKAFKRSIRRKCRYWETVPDKCIEK